MIFFDAEETERRGKSRGRLSIISWYDSEIRELRTVTEEDLDFFIIAARDADLLIGYNVFAFDFGLFEDTLYPVTEANDRDSGKTLDFYLFLRDQLGLKRGERPKGLSLNALGIVNLGMGKIKLTAPASALFITNPELVKAYNKRDVIILRDLFFKALSEGYLLYNSDVSEKEMEADPEAFLFSGELIDTDGLDQLMGFLQGNFYKTLVGW